MPRLAALLTLPAAAGSSSPLVGALGPCTMQGGCLCHSVARSSPPCSCTAGGFTQEHYKEILRVGVAGCGMWLGGCVGLDEEASCTSTQGCSLILPNLPNLCAGMALLQTYCDEALKAYVRDSLKPRYQVGAGHTALCVLVGAARLLSGRASVLWVLAGALQAAARSLPYAPALLRRPCWTPAAADPRPCRMCRTPTTTTAWHGSCGTTPSARQTACSRCGHRQGPADSWRLSRALCLAPCCIPAPLPTPDLHPALAMLPSLPAGAAGAEDN